MVFLPEAVDYIGESKQQSIDMAEDLNGKTISKYQDLAKQLGVWISVGGFHQKVKLITLYQLGCSTRRETRSFINW